MKNFVPASSTFEHWLGDINYDPKKRELYPFMVRVGVIKYRPPRHSCFEFLINFGVVDIEKALYHKGKLSGHLTFVFPERYMSIHEQRSFMYQICRHPTVDKITQIDIITSCPLVISDFTSEMVRIITWPEDEDEKELLPFYKHK